MSKRELLAPLLIAVIGAVVFLAAAKFNSATIYARALQIANKTGISNKAMCVYLPNQKISFDLIDTAMFKRWNNSLRYFVNSENLSVTKSQSKNALRQKFIPSQEGSERVIGAFSIDSRKTYELKQNIFFEEGFDWGGNAESGKFGFGLGGGSTPSGGKTDKDGFTVRLAWFGQGDGTVTANLYSYSVDRNQNLPYGDLFTIPNFVVPVGDWFEVAMRVSVNSDLDIADGSLSVMINDQLVFERENIHWQSEGPQPSIDTLIFSTFHGGNTPDWTPDRTVFAQFSDICLFD